MDRATKAEGCSTMMNFLKQYLSHASIAALWQCTKRLDDNRIDRLATRCLQAPRTNCNEFSEEQGRRSFEAASSSSTHYLENSTMELQRLECCGPMMG